MPVDKVYFHTSFFYGEIKTDRFRDLATFDPSVQEDFQHLECIYNFADDILEGVHVAGKNVYNEGKAYEACKAAHYHSGPYTDLNYTTSHISQANKCGARSGAAIHYCWKGNKNEIIILGYSPIKHDDPFPQLHHKNNPLRPRLKLVYNNGELVNYE